MSTQVTHHSDPKVTLGFWVYLMTDCLLFASLFATYVVLRHNTWNAATSHELFNLPFVLVETLLLLTSSFTCGLAMLALYRRQKAAIIRWLVITFLVGAAFLGMELYEFHQLVQEGNSWRASAFLSAFFTLVGTHGLHIAIGLLWIGVLLVKLTKKGLTPLTAQGILLLSLFWHFLDIIWIFIFTVVYLMGALPV